MYSLLMHSRMFDRRDPEAYRFIDTGLFINYQMMDLSHQDNFTESCGIRTEYLREHVLDRSGFAVDLYRDIENPNMQIYRKTYRQTVRAQDWREKYERERERRRLRIVQILSVNFHDDRCWRYRRLSQNNLKTVRNLNKELGKIVSEVMKELKTSSQISRQLSRKVANIINAFNYIGVACSAITNYDYYNTLRITTCDHCGELYSLIDLTHPVSSHEYVCSKCLARHFLHSDIMGGYIRRNDALPFYEEGSDPDDDPDGYVTHSYARNRGWVYYDGIVYESDDDAVDAGYEPDVDENSDNYLPGWHASERNFVERNAGPYPALGVELEIYAPNRRELVFDLRRCYGELVQMERDGSLNSEHGVEIISQPLGRAEWIDFAPKLLKLTNEHGAVGYNEPAGTAYGIHISIHRRHFSPLAEARLSMFFADTNNAQFVRAVAQRNQIYGADSGVGIGYTDLKNHPRKVFTICRHIENGKITGRGKYCCINWKNEIAEFRLFQSTVNISSFMKNLEFVWALHAWVQTAQASGNSYSHRDFVRWLNTPARRKEFPFLTNFLSKREFYGSNYEPIVSTWQDLMIKPQLTPAVEPIAA